MTRDNALPRGQDPYAVLGIGPDATAGQVARAFRARVRELHPDTSARHDRGGPELQAVLSAWRILHDPQRRAAYDRTRAPAPAQSPAWPRPGSAGPQVAMRIGPPVWIEYRRSGG